MITGFADEGTQDIYNGDNTKAARKVLPGTLWNVAFRKLDMVNSATRLDDLKVPPSNHLEALKGNLQGKHSIRINDQYRLVFVWENGNASGVYIDDYH